MRNPDTLAPTQGTSVPSPGHYGAARHSQRVSGGGRRGVRSTIRNSHFSQVLQRPPNHVGQPDRYIVLVSLSRGQNRIARLRIAAGPAAAAIWCTVPGDRAGDCNPAPLAGARAASDFFVTRSKLTPDMQSAQLIRECSGLFRSLCMRHTAAVNLIPHAGS